MSFPLLVALSEQECWVPKVNFYSYSKLTVKIPSTRIVAFLPKSDTPGSWNKIQFNIECGEFRFEEMPNRFTDITRTMKDSALQG